MLGYAVVLIVILKHLSQAWRWAAAAVAVVMVAASGFSRVALAAHYVSDVVAAYLLGLAWVVTLAAVFHVWRRPPLDPAGATSAQTRHPKTSTRTLERESPAL